MHGPQGIMADVARVNQLLRRDTEETLASLVSPRRRVVFADCGRTLMARPPIQNGSWYGTAGPAADLMADDVHPNSRGHLLLAGCVRDVLNAPRDAHGEST